MNDYDINKKLASQYLDYLEREYIKWYSTPNKKERTKIEREIQSTVNYWDDTIYIWLNEERASGLFEPGFFESDMHKSMQMLRDLLHDKNNRR